MIPCLSLPHLCLLHQGLSCSQNCRNGRHKACRGAQSLLAELSGIVMREGLARVQYHLDTRAWCAGAEGSCERGSRSGWSVQTLSTAALTSTIDVPCTCYIIDIVMQQ